MESTQKQYQLKNNIEKEASLRRKKDVPFSISKLLKESKKQLILSKKWANKYNIQLKTCDWYQKVPVKTCNKSTKVIIKTCIKS